MALSGILDLHKRLQAINKEMLIIEAIEQNSEQLRELQIDQHLKGEDAKGQKIRPKYSDSYLKRKKRTGYGLDGTPDLHLSGLFHEETNIIVQEREYFFTSFADYTKYLAARYGDIFGLKKENISKAIQINTKLFVKLWKDKAGLQ